MGNSPVDRDKKYMMKMWGTSKLVTDYVKMENMNQKSNQKMLREIAEDDLTPKKHDFFSETELFEKNDKKTDKNGPKPLYES